MTRNLVVMGALLFGWAAPARGQFEEGLPVGTKAPVIMMELLDGTTVDFASFLGKKPVLIEFWATWCERCQAMLPRLKAAHAKYGDQVEWIGVNVTINQSKSRVQRYMEQEKPPFRALWDGKGTAARAYEAFTTSYILIVDRTGTVIYTESGGDQDIDTPLKKAIGTGSEGR